MLGLAIAIVVAVALWFLQGQTSAIRRSGKRLPRPPGTLPLAGNGIWFLQPRHRLLGWFAQTQPLVGFDTYEVTVPSLPAAIVINDPKNVEHVLKNNDLFIKGEFFRSRSWDLFGHGIINADGELWKVQRKAGLRFFSNANLKSFIDETLPPLLDGTEELLDRSLRERQIVDLQQVLLELTTRLMGKVAYDMDMHGSLPFSKSFDFASGVIGDRFQNPFWKLKEAFFGARLRQAVREVKDFGQVIVASSIAKRKEGYLKSEKASSKSADPLQGNLINSLLDHIEDHQVVADSAMNFLSAGRDTTAQSLTWAFYLLMRHPRVITQIRQELCSAFPNLLRNASPSLPLTFEDVQPSSLPYIMAVFNETIRLYPPVPFEIKECTAPTTFPDGTWLPQGAVVLWVPWAMGRSNLIWGEDAACFRPERWLIEDSRSKDGHIGGSKPTLMTKTAYEFPVFNAGPRLCLGKKMAESLAVYVLASLVWSYDFEEVREKRLGGVVEGQERVPQQSLTLPMQGGLPCRVKRKESAI